MREQKFHIYLDNHERTILLHSLVELKNQLLAQGRYTDCVDELIFKVTGAPLKRLKVHTIAGGYDGWYRIKRTVQGSCGNTEGKDDRSAVGSRRNLSGGL